MLPLLIASRHSCSGPLFSGWAGDVPAASSRKSWGTWGQEVCAGEPGRERDPRSGYPPRGARLGPRSAEGPGSTSLGFPAGTRDAAVSPVEEDRGHSGMSSPSSLGLGMPPAGARGCLPWENSDPPGGLTPRPDPTIHLVLVSGVSRHPQRRHPKVLSLPGHRTQARV